MSPSVGRGGGEACNLAGRTKRSCLLLSVCFTQSDNIPLSSLFSLSLLFSLPFFYAPLFSVSSLSNCPFSLLYMLSAFPTFFPVIPSLSHLSAASASPLTYSVCLLQFLLLDKNFAFSASCNNFGALWLSSQIFGPCATWAYFYLFAGAVGKGPEEGRVVGRHDELLPEFRF